MNRLLGYLFAAIRLCSRYPWWNFEWKGSFEERRNFFCCIGGFANRYSIFINKLARELETETCKGSACHRYSYYHVYEKRREYERVPRLWHALSTMHILMKIVLWQRKRYDMMVEDVLEQLFFMESQERQSRDKMIFDHRV